jgi:hypothetical protein
MVRLEGEILDLAAVVVVIIEDLVAMAALES